MSNIAYLITVFIAVWMQSIFNLKLFGSPLQCDFVLIVLVPYALRKGPAKAFAMGILTGFIFDCMSNGIFGWGIIQYSIIGALLGVFHRILFTQFILSHIIFLLLAFSAKVIIFLFLFQLYNIDLSYLVWFKTIFTTLIITVIFSFLIYSTMRQKGWITVGREPLL